MTYEVDEEEIDLKEEMVDFIKKSFSGLEDVETRDFEFDMEAAIYWYAHDWYDGQTDPLYEILSTSDYSPGPLMKGVESEGGVAEMIYDELVSEYEEEEDEEDEEDEEEEEEEKDEEEEE